MAYLEANLPPIKVFVRRAALYDWKEGITGYEKGILISARPIEGSVMLFQVLLENGIMRDKLPIHAIAWKEAEEEVWEQHPFHQAQIWNCLSTDFSVVELKYISGAKVDVWTKQRKWEPGTYLWTFQWAGNRNTNANLNLAEDPTEHKSGHFLQMEYGGFYMQPNNRIRWYEPSFVTKPYPAKPDHKINTHSWNCEQHEKWASEDSDRQMYGVGNNEEDADTRI